MSQVHGCRTFAVVLPFTFLFPLIGSAQDYPSVGDPARWEMLDRYLERAPILASAGFAPEPHWLEGGSRFWYLSEAEAEGTVMLVDPATGSVSPIFEVDEVRSAMGTFGVEDLPPSGLPFQSLELTEGDRVVRLHSASAIYELDLETFHLRSLSAGAMGSGASDSIPGVDTQGERDVLIPRTHEWITLPEVWWSPDESKVAVLQEENVWIVWPATGREAQLTFDGEEYVRYDYFNPSVAGTWANWSPDSKHLILVRTDQRHLGRRPVANWLDPDAAVSYETRFEEAGNAHQQLIHWNAETGNLTAFDLDLRGADARWFAIYGWTPDGTELFVGRSFFSERSEDIVALNPATGQTRVVLTESGEVFPDAGGLTFFEDGFIWGSDRDGYRQLYRYDFDGRLVAQLTSGDFRTKDVMAIDEASAWVYFTAFADTDRPYDTHLCRVRLDGTGFAVLTEADGVHSVTLSPDGTYFLDQHQSPIRPPRTDLRRTDGTFVRNLTSSDLARFREELDWEDTEEFVVKAADGETDLWGRIYKPHDFDPSKKYPVVHYIYTTYYPGYGPGFEGGYQAAYAQLGFIVVQAALRGEQGARSRDFRSAFYGRIGCCEHEDVAAVLHQLGEDRPYMDMERVGIWGGSWGGYHAIRFMLLKPDLFKVGVAERPRVQVSEDAAPFMGTLAQNPDGYAESSNVSLADRLEGKLLLIVNLLDVNVPAVFRMIDALIEAGRPHDLLVVPGVGHLHRLYGEKGAAADHFIWERMMGAYFVEHLVEEGSADQ